MEILKRSSPVGSRVYWSTVLGNEFNGILKEWDGNVAIVDCTDGMERAVEVND